MIYYTVYQITDLLNGKIYIGKHQTTNIDDSYMGSGKLLTRSQKKHGLENFKKDILFIFNNEEEMNSKEAELVTEDFCLREDTYNICPGGKGGWGYFNSNYENGFKNKTHNEQTLEKMRNSFLGKKHTVETKKKLSKISSDRKGDLNSFFNKNHTEESKNKISQKKKNKITAYDLNLKCIINVDSDIFHSSSNLIGVRKAKFLELI